VKVAGDALFAMGFFAMLLPVLAICYTIYALVAGWASPLEAGIAALVVLTQVALTIWGDQRRKWVSEIGWGTVIILAHLIGRLSTVPRMGGVAQFLASSMPLWYSALVLGVVIVLVP
jgi:hypothetical protein